MSERVTPGRPRGAVLLGHPRSGTTLLRRLLNAHPAIAAPPETHLFGACARFVSADRTAEGVDMGVLAGLEFAGLPEEDVLERLRNLAFGLMDDLAAQNDASLWVEKTAFDTFNLDGIEQVCGDHVRFIGIVRHPVDVAASTQEFCQSMGTYPTVLHRYVQQYPQLTEAFCRSWLHCAEQLMSLGERRQDQVFLCRYEDLVDDPDDIVSQLLEFLEVDDTDTAFVADALVHRGQPGFGDHKSHTRAVVHSDSVGASRRLPAAQLSLLAPLLNPALNLLGYEPLDADIPAPTVAESRRRYVKAVAAQRVREENSP